MPKTVYTLLISVMCLSCGAPSKYIYVHQPKNSAALINDKDKHNGNCKFSVDTCNTYTLKIVDKKDFIKYHYINSCNIVKDTTIIAD
jgi:hypothetical protein